MVSEFNYLNRMVVLHNTSLWYRYRGTTKRNISIAKGKIWAICHPGAIYRPIVAHIAHIVAFCLLLDFQLVSNNKCGNPISLNIKSDIGLLLRCSLE